MGTLFSIGKVIRKYDLFIINSQTTMYRFIIIQYIFDVKQ